MLEKVTGEKRCDCVYMWDLQCPQGLPQLCLTCIIIFKVLAQGKGKNTAHVSWGEVRLWPEHAKGLGRVNFRYMRKELCWERRYQAKQLVSPLCKASGTWHPCDFVLLKPDSRLRKSHSRVVMFYLDWFPKRREAGIIALVAVDRKITGFLTCLWSIFHGLSWT